MKTLVGAFNQEKALVGAFSVIVQPVVEPMDRFAALPATLFPCSTVASMVAKVAATEQWCSLQCVELQILLTTYNRDRW